MTEEDLLSASFHLHQWIADLYYALATSKDLQEQLTQTKSRLINLEETVHKNCVEFLAHRTWYEHTFNWATVMSNCCAKLLSNPTDIPDAISAKADSVRNVEVNSDPASQPITPPLEAQ